MPPTRPMTIVTTSWDDGDLANTRIAELLRSRGLAGTFYIPIIGYDGRPTLDAAGLRSLRSEGFEIGAHGLSHHTLPKFRLKELSREVRICKTMLEDSLGEEVCMFSYPKGRFNSTVIEYLKDAGYKGARTARMLSTGMNFNAFKMPTSIQVFPHSQADYFRNMGRARDLGGLYDCMRYLNRKTRWTDLGMTLFDRALKEGGIWHLFGHSWEIDENGLWENLEKMLDYVSGREGVHYVSNSDLLKFLPSNNVSLVSSAITVKR